MACFTSPVELLLAEITNAIIASTASRPIPGIGIPMLIAPTAALIATILDPQQRAPLAYIGGTLGVMIGADLIRLMNASGEHRPV